MRPGPAIAAGILSAACAASLSGQSPSNLANARVETRDAARGLEGTFRAESAGPGPRWIGYRVPSPEGHHLCCDGNDGWGCGRQCSLEDSNGSVSVNRSGRGAREGSLEGALSGGMLLFYRVERGHTTRLRLFADDCTVDGGGMPVVWLTAVRPAESVELLSRLVEKPPEPSDASGEGDRLPGQRAITAIALHEDAAADAALERFASAGLPETTRKKAIFWLGNARGERGYQVLRRLASDEPSDSIRKHVTFALSQSPVPAATEALIGMARKDPSAHVRGQALFWLAHKAGRRASEAIEDAIADDPETEVKKKAVFALTQLPSDESVTQLIRVARTNRNPVVRKQALFWLGQSKDPRALTYIEEVLTK